MIKGDKALAIIGTLQDSNFEFHLTGSRAFGTAGVGSDYDFFTDRSDDVEWYLEMLGFKKVHSTTYSDPSLVSLWQKGKVHIQLVTDAAKKSAIQAVFVKQLFGQALADKLTGRLLWLTAWHMFEAGEKYKGGSS